MALLGLGGLGAWDIARYLGNRAGRSVMADDWVERKDPEYEKAEEEWAKGNYIDAIGLMDGQPRSTLSGGRRTSW